MADGGNISISVSPGQIARIAKALGAILVVAISVQTGIIKYGQPSQAQLEARQDSLNAITLRQMAAMASVVANDNERHNRAIVAFLRENVIAELELINSQLDNLPATAAVRNYHSGQMDELRRVRLELLLELRQLETAISKKSFPNPVDKNNDAPEQTKPTPPSNGKGF